MFDPHDIGSDELHILKAAMEAPLVDRDPTTVALCLRLCGRRLLQRAGTASQANGWHGSPHAFVLTREGWAYLKAERRRAPIRRAG